MKVAFIQCPAWGRDCPPYTLAYFKALLSREGFEVSIYDVNNLLYHSGGEAGKKYWDDKDYYSYWENPELLKKLIEDNEQAIDRVVREIVSGGVRVVGFTTHTTSFIISLELARRIKKADSEIVIIFGGPQCSRSQAAASLIKQPEVDYVCPGEGDIVLPELLKKLQDGFRGPHRGFLFKDKKGIVDGGDPEVPTDLDALPFPDYEPFRNDIENGRYKDSFGLGIFDSRGCITCCHFCSEWSFWKKYRTMSGKRIYEEIKYQIEKFPKVHFFYFNGSLVNGDLSVLETWCDLVIKSGMKIRWAGQLTANPSMTKSLINKMKASGCMWLGFGIESGCERVLEKMNKGYSIPGALKVLKDAHEAGISIQINIMFGMPTETREDFEKTLKFLVLARPYIDTVLASQSFCVIDKGTYLHRNPEKFGITGEDHHLFWKSNNGENNYAERFRRYEEFCDLALKLGLPETSGVLKVKPDKWFLLGQYYEHEKEFAKAAGAYKRSIDSESDNKVARENMNRCLEKAG